MVHSRYDNPWILKSKLPYSRYRYSNVQLTYKSTYNITIFYAVFYPLLSAWVTATIQDNEYARDYGALIDITNAIPKDYDNVL
jgi:hypothetical protein